MNVVEDQAFLLPGRVPGLKRTDKKLLPTSMTKSRLWKRCVETSKASVQCHITTPQSKANASLQNDQYDVTTELRKQILNLTEVVKQLTALKCLHQHEPGPASLRLLDDDSDFSNIGFRSSRISGEFQ